MMRTTLEYWRAGGPLLFLLAPVCFGIWLYFLRIRSGLQRAIREGAELECMLETLADSTPPSFRDGIKNLSGVTGSVLAGTIASAEAGESAALAFDRQRDRALDRLKRDLVILAALTAAAPLVGLLGTVMGMIDTFAATAATGQETSTRVAGGISQALITTQVGLVVAIPGVFGMARLNRLYGNLHARMAVYKTHLLRWWRQRGVVAG